MAANQNVTQLTQQTGSAALTSLFYAVTNGANDTGLPLSVLVNSLGLTGTPTAPTATTGTNTTQIASTAFVQAQLTSSLAPYAPLANPTFTGTVVIPTVTLSGGTINGTTIGATTPSTGSFTTLASSGLANLSSLSTSSATLTGGSINGTSIGATTPSTGKFTSLTTTGAYTPSTTAGIVGTTLADSAAAGAVGEVLTVTATGVAATSATLGNVTSLSLTAGDWDIYSSFQAIPAGSTIVQALNFGLTTTSAAQAAFPNAVLMPTPGTVGGQGFTVNGPIMRLNISTTTTVYLTAATTFTTSTLTHGGYILARRRR